MREANLIDKLFLKHIREVLQYNSQAKMQLYEKVEWKNGAMTQFKDQNLSDIKKEKAWWMMLYSEMVDSVQVRVDGFNMIA